ncbi:phage major capsid protein [Marinobacter sp.]|jgi:HK97 family phage major capsid protein|uniref:phage major capsid protein n=1 Tax=Marinobacter sp. TaxID=50741 RepID=UPI000C96F133|nr:phage major capsid protein [Marinobacter sp.]MAK51586.1 phage major capsid protein [Marinobacter sp.]|tara:strand:+ start:1327 stop:2553 length:1227 start_codon:yes stop_codon:yes gene_type:complete
MSDDINLVQEAVEGLGKAFEEFKATNDKKLADLEKKGGTDPLVEDKLKNIEADLDKYEDINQKLTKAEMESRSHGEKLAEIETMLKRPEAGLTTEKVDLSTKAFDKWLRKGKENLEPEELKAITVSDDSSAGYLAPPEYVRELIKTLTEISPVRSIARVRSTTQKAVQIPSRTATFSAQWVAEQGTRSETTGYTTKLEEIPTHEVYALVDISEQELEDAAFNLEAEMQQEFADQFAKAEGNATTVGDAIGKPEGFMTNSSVGTTNTGHASTLQADGLLDLVHAIKSPYAQNATMVFNRTTLAAIRQLKDTAGQYVFQAGMMLTAGVPNSILGFPYVEMPDMADVGAGNKPIAFGDFSRGYMVVDRVALSVLRDPFTQATSGNVRYVARRRVGGQVILAEALRTQTVSA